MTRRKYRLAALIYALVITAASLQPQRPEGLHSSGLHPPLHLLCFIGFVVLTHQGFPGSSRLLWIIPLAALLGVGIEFMQHWEFHEAVEWNDVRSDAIGAAVGGLLCLLSNRREIVRRSSAN